jgi:thioredoxin reductase
MSEQFDEIFDVLVIGSGCGGLTAALTADISNPAKVLVIEKVTSLEEQAPPLEELFGFLITILVKKRVHKIQFLKPKIT